MVLESDSRGALLDELEATPTISDLRKTRKFYLPLHHEDVEAKYCHLGMFMKRSTGLVIFGTCYLGRG